MPIRVMLDDPAQRFSYFEWEGLNAGSTREGPAPGERSGTGASPKDGSWLGPCETGSPPERSEGVPARVAGLSGGAQRNRSSPERSAGLQLEAKRRATGRRPALGCEAAPTEL